MVETSTNLLYTLAPPAITSVLFPEDVTPGTESRFIGLVWFTTDTP